MTSYDTAIRWWLNRPARPTAVVLFAAAALLAVLAAIALIDLFTAPLPPVQYGPFGGPHTLTGAVVLMAMFLALGARAARGFSPKALALTLIVLIAAGPVGWGVAFLDSLGPDVINSVGSTGAFVSVILLVATPLLTIVGVVAALAEIIRRGLGAPEIRHDPKSLPSDHSHGQTPTDGIRSD